ncbi:MAG: class I mannose-6-phosphate isomerase [Bacteroidales bacterium]|nr:class I mannose-6-phosphate isomerase [Bacteroidales bacterium]
MEEEKKLVPFRLCKLEDKYPWGTEEWALADLGWRDTPVRDGWLAGNLMDEMMETYLDRISGDGVFEWYGKQFPFCIKTLNVNGRMPLTACPADELAAERYDSLGKEKLWYVLDAEAGAKILLGLKRDTPVSAFMDACADGSVEGLLNQAPVKAGAYFHIPPGVPHAIFGKARILEISESSALDFRLCNWDALSDGDDFGLGLVEALDFLSLSRFPSEGLLGYSLEGRREGDPANVSRMAALPQFSAAIISLDDPIKISAGEGNSCVAYSCIKGEFSVQLPPDWNGGASPLTAKAGETVLVPAECQDFILAPLAPGTLLVETLVEPRAEEDSYLK